MDLPVVVHNTHQATYTINVYLVFFQFRLRFRMLFVQVITRGRRPHPTLTLIEENDFRYMKPSISILTFSSGVGPHLPLLLRVSFHSFPFRCASNAFCRCFGRSTSVRSTVVMGRVTSRTSPVLLSVLVIVTSCHTAIRTGWGGGVEKARRARQDKTTPHNTKQDKTTKLVL